MFDAIWWYACSLMMFHLNGWCFMLVDDASWYLMNCDDMWWYVMIFDLMMFDDTWFDDIWSYVMICDVVWWYLAWVCHSLGKLTFGEETINLSHQLDPCTVMLLSPGHPCRCRFFPGLPCPKGIFWHHCTPMRRETDWNSLFATP